MRKISAFLALIALCLAQLAFASGLVTSATGTVQVSRGTSPAAPLREGDEVNQGDTISTAPASSVVVKFDDGHVAALTANSRMTITAYRYDPQQQTGNVLLSLVTGGMRAISGLIGKHTPSNVGYRVANTTIGIRGTHHMSATDGRDTVAIVLEGSISVTVRGQTYTVLAGEGIDAREDGGFRKEAAQEIIRRLPPGLAITIGGLQTLTDAINRAAPGVPKPFAAAPGNVGTPNPAGGPTGGGTGPTVNSASPS